MSTATVHAAATAAATLAATAFAVTVDEDTESPSTWLELPRPNPDFDISAVRNYKTERWEVDAYLPGASYTAEEAIAIAEALSTAAQQVATMNAPELDEAVTHEVPC